MDDEAKNKNDVIAAVKSFHNSSVMLKCTVSLHASFTLNAILTIL